MINTQVQQTAPMRVLTTELELQDEFVNMDQLTMVEDASVFRLELMPFTSYEKDYDVQVDVTVERNLSLQIIQREGYNAFDLLSDIGGLQQIIFSIITIFIAFWNFNNFDDYMVTRLFKLKYAETERLSLRACDRSRGKTM